MHADHLAVPPRDDFWIAELGFARFPAFVPLLDDAKGLSKLLEQAWAGPTPSKVLRALLDAHGDTPAVRLHLLLVAEFVRGKKSGAVRDVARAFPGADELEALGCRGGHLPRIPVAALLYCKDPSCLLAMDACHRWHSSRREALELAGPRRSPPLAELEWDELGAAAVEGLPESLRARYRPSYKLMIPRDCGNEVLLAFREPAEYAAVKADNGDVVAGRRERWTILRFHQEALRVDVTAHHNGLGRELANAVANQIWHVNPPLQYLPAKGKLTAADLQTFLRRLLDPDDDRFQLLEITIRVGALAGNPDLTLSAPGQSRAEAALLWLRQRVTLAESWQAVHQVKLGFEGRYRVSVQFPAEGEPMRLTYSDAERDKDACKAFERMFLEELGVSIVPHVARRRRRKRPSETPRPKKPGPKTWRRLLSPVLDHPKRWELEMVRGLKEKGLVTYSEHSFFRCGDPAIPREAACGPADSLDCPGEIEMPYGALDPNDPHRQEDDAEYTCSLCGRAWFPGRYRLELSHRLRVHLRHAEFWGLLLEAAGEQGRFEEEAPGVASGMVAGTRTYLVYLLLAPEPWRSQARFAGFRACWVSAPGDPELERYGDAGMDLAEFLADRNALARRLSARVPTSYTLEQVVAMVTPLLPGIVSGPGGRLTAEQQMASAQMPERVQFSRDSKGVWMGTEKIASPRATGLVKILALLQRGADLDEAAGRSRRHRTAEALARFVPGLKYQTVQTWISRARTRIDVAASIGGLGGRVIEGGKRGYRLGPAFDCLGFELEEVFELPEHR